MKRNITVAAIVLLIGCLFLTGCPQASGASPETPDTPETPVTPDTPDTPATPTVPDDFVLIPAGTFTMGIKSKAHSVTLTRNIIMCDHEVTQGEYSLAGCTYGGNMNWGSGSEYPVYWLNWYEAIIYCNKRSIKEKLTPCYEKGGSTNPKDWGLVPTSQNEYWNKIVCNWDANGYRLPTEAEWEYAARAGNTTTDSRIYSGTTSEEDLENYAWLGSGTAKPVKTKQPNAWGLYDMSGNVWEWCWDWYGDYSSSDVTDPKGLDTGKFRVVRGGSYLGQGYAVTSRDSSEPQQGYYTKGFRVVRNWSN